MQLRSTSYRRSWMGVGLIVILGNQLAFAAGNESSGSQQDGSFANVLGLTGNVRGIRMATPESKQIESLATAHRTADIDLRNMAGWAMNYLIHTPRPQLGYEPVFQCHPLKCPPIHRPGTPHYSWACREYFPRPSNKTVSDRVLLCNQNGRDVLLGKGNRS